MQQDVKNKQREELKLLWIKAEKMRKLLQFERSKKKWKSIERSS